jgi:hypothetical protein
MDMNELPAGEKNFPPADLGRLPAQLDLNELAVARVDRPEEPLWATLARLGWVPPSTAQDMRRRIHELEVELRNIKGAS